MARHDAQRRGRSAFVRLRRDKERGRRGFWGNPAAVARMCSLMCGYMRINRKKVAQMPSGSSHVVHKICSVIFWRSEKCEILRKCEGEYKSFNSYEYFNTEKFEDENDCIRPNPSNSELLRPFKGKFAIVQVGCIALPFRPELVNVTNSWRI